MNMFLQKLIVLALLYNLVASSSIITTLPGFPGDLPFVLETGYVGVGVADNVQLFYYFIESEGNLNRDPLVLWLNGGPGCSGFASLVDENIGPLSFDHADSVDNKPQLKLNPYSWTKVTNIIFIDAPVGTGFSYAKRWEEYRSLNDTISATLTYQFLRKWLVDHPRFLSNPLYIAGVSYGGGIGVPIIVQKISNGNDHGVEPRMNLQGYVVGNPVTDEARDANSKIQFAYLKALIPEELYESLKRNCKGEYVSVDPNNALCLRDLELYNDCIQDINHPQIFEPRCTLTSPKLTKTELDRNGFSDTDLDPPSTPWCRSYNYIPSFLWANDKTVQSALHVRKGSIKEWVRCNATIITSHVNDITSTVRYHKNFTTKGYRVLIYSGDLDMQIPYVGTATWIKSLNLTVKSPWKPWFVNAQIAGYRVTYTLGTYELTYTTVKGAGHTGPEYKPEECFAMISRWFSYHPL